MRKLLSAEIYRCGHSVLFWLMLAASVLAGLFFGISSRGGVFEDVFVVPLFVIIAIFISLHIGAEYADKTIRNKIITGNTKTAILLSNLIFGVGTGLLFCAAFLIPCVSALAVGVFSKIPASVFLWTVLGFVLLTVVWAVLFTVISTLVSTRGLGGILNLGLIMGIMFLSYQLQSLLSQPEFIISYEGSSVQMTAEEVRELQEGKFQGSYSMSTDENGKVTYYKEVINDTNELPNPKYVKEPFHRILDGLYSMLPHGQINETVSLLTEWAYISRHEQPDIISENNPVNALPRLKSFPLYSCFDLLLLSCIGLLLFRKKEIR